jgi:NAD(P)-dependent dehydrogenase (short-subunit alcohol dehydrogenase family)
VDFSTSHQGRSAIVTGAGNGLGLAIAKRLVRSGARVLLIDSDEAVLERVGENDLPRGSVFALVKDFSDADAGSFVFSHLAETIGHADILINNAAWSFHKPMLGVTVEEFDRLVAINQRAPYFLAQEFMRRVAQSTVRIEDPVIVNIASVNALAGNADLVAYAGTKGALVAMTRAMAVEMSQLHIRVNAISPGAVETFVTKNLIEAGVIDPPKVLADLLTKRFCSCEEVAELVAYICSSAAGYVNGANWVIDGGYVAH